MENNILQGVFDDWQVIREIGRGSYGSVYEAVRTQHSIESKAAVKIISISTDSSDVADLNEEDARIYMHNMVNDFVNEIQLMEQVKGVQNIVSVDDYKVMERLDGSGWDIFIRMELLTPFTEYVASHEMTEKEIIHLGKDICSALSICSKLNIIHRDIKPENIFVNKFGDYKLGDFGIARTLTNATSNLSFKGTYNYMAPEIFHGFEYDQTVDIYSLGVVLYRYANENRLPFIDGSRQFLSPSERNEAVKRRLNGEPIPAPVNASNALVNVILNACNYDRNERFSNPDAMKRALEFVEKNPDIDVERIQQKPLQNPGIYYSDNETVNVRSPKGVHSNGGYPNTFTPYNSFTNVPQKKEKGKLGSIIVLIVAAVVLVLSLGALNSIGLPMIGSEPIVKIAPVDNAVYKMIYGVNKLDDSAKRLYRDLLESQESSYRTEIDEYEKSEGKPGVSFYDANNDGVVEMILMTRNSSSTNIMSTMYINGNGCQADSAEGTFADYGKKAENAAIDVEKALEILE